jgi:hypothetical protein
MTQLQLLDLARLSDKYDLSRLFLAAIELKKWLEPYKGVGAAWPATVDLQDFIFIILTFGYGADYSCLVNCLAMDLQIENNLYYYSTISSAKKVQIRAYFPTAILDKLNLLSVSFHVLD